MRSKLLSIFVLLGLLGSITSGFFIPTKAEASVPVFETNASIIASNLQTAATTFSDLGQNLYEWAFTFVISTLKKQLLDVIVDQIIGYIQGGGKPQFVTDWKSFLADAGQGAVGEFAQSIGAGFLCAPFSLQVQINLLPVPKFSQKAQCTLDQIVGNIQAFYNDFRAGGWIGYGTAWEPQNNYFGALLMTTFEAERRRGIAESTAYAEAMAGGGFKSARDKNGNIVTPGSTLNSLTSKAVESDIDYILSADQLSDYASAIASALFNRVLQEGIAKVQTSVSGGAGAQQNVSDLIANNFNFLKDSILTQINQTLEPRLAAKTALIDSFSAITTYQTQLNSLISAFNATGKTTCQSSTPFGTNVEVAAAKQAIESELAMASSTIAQIQTDLAENQVIIDTLTAAANEIISLPSDNSGFVRLNEINGQIAGQINPSAAVSFKSAVDEQNIAIKDNITAKLTTFNQQLTTCQNAL